MSDMSRKIGIHIIGGTSVPLGRPAVIKLCDPSSEYVAQVRQQVGPDTLIVVRWTLAEQPLDNPQVRAYWWYARHMNSLLPMLNHKPIAFEGYNEIADAQAERYCQFEIARMRHLHDVGASAVVGNFSVGTPDFPTWAAYKPLLDAMGPGDYVGLHEYWADWESLHNTYHVRRFLRVPELAGKQIVITECGRDVVEGRGDGGWKKDRWLGADQYVAELAELGRLYDACPQVVGAAVFTVGGFGWGDFDVSEIWPHVVAGYAEPQPVEPAERWETVSVCEFDAGDEHLRSTIERRVE